jgi:methionyl-tRNA formyltransferase
MRVGFAGTPDFAVQALRAIREAGYTIPLVLTQPDRPHGRGLRVTPSPVKAYALGHGLAVVQPATLKDETARAAPLAVPLDVLVVAAYGLILPRAVLDWPRLGCLNIHASRLPRWRGAAPIARAIEAGDAETGVSIMQMEAGLDTGPVLAETVVPIELHETAGSLHDKLAHAGARAIVGVLDALARGEALVARPQPADGVTYAAKLDRAEAAIDWRAPARTVDRRIRALDPVPGAHARFGGDIVKLAGSSLAGTSAQAPGTITHVSAEGLDVACGDGGVVRIARLKPAGAREMDASAFAAGRNVRAGARFDAD